MSKQRHQAPELRSPGKKHRLSPSASLRGGVETMPVEESIDEKFIGHWRIVKMEGWARKDVDEEGPAYIAFAQAGLGELHALLINADIDWSYDADIGRVDFSFQGFEEMDQVSGRGWAKLAGRGKELVGEIAIHLGYEFGFKAKRTR